MRTVLALLLVAACGGKDNPAKDAPPNPGDAPSDAAPDAANIQCANPSNGTNVSFRKLGDPDPNVRSIPGPALLVTAPANDPRLFVVDQTGRIWIFENEQRLAEPFLDLSPDAGGPVRSGGELGLLGLAFHPQYASNGQFFVYYTQADGTRFRDVLARCARSAADPNKADPASCLEVLAIPDFAANHNGGMIEFGADGYLYIGTGDGGGGGDPNGNGQAVVDGSPEPGTVALLGKMLRIDVDNKLAGKEYGIPADNPFAAGGGAPEIFMLGLRNPWRWTFDRATGDMWIADVGQNLREELNVVKAGDQKGKNFGWKMWEGTNCFAPPCTMTGMTFPQDERTHAEGWASITGGQVYRGTCYPDLVGTYFYADFVGRRYAKATLNADGTLDVVDLPPQNNVGGPASIHADGVGELWLTTVQGNVYRLEATP